MISKEIIFADDNGLIIQTLVDEYKLAAKEKKLKNATENDTILSVGKIAQLCRDLVEKRISLKGMTSQLQESFGLSSAIAEELLEKINENIISKTTEVLIKENGTQSIISSGEISIDTKKRNYAKQKENIDQDTYREPVN